MILLSFNTNKRYYGGEQSVIHLIFFSDICSSLASEFYISWSIQMAFFHGHHHAICTPRNITYAKEDYSAEHHDSIAVTSKGKSPVSLSFVCIKKWGFRLTFLLVSWEHKRGQGFCWSTSLLFLDVQTRRWSQRVKFKGVQCWEWDLLSTFSCALKKSTGEDSVSSHAPTFQQVDLVSSECLWLVPRRMLAYESGETDLTKLPRLGQSKSSRKPKMMLD